MTFGERIRTARKKKNLSTQEIADECGVARSYITLIENNKRLPGRKVIPKLAEALNVKTNIIVNWYLDDIREKLL